MVKVRLARFGTKKHPYYHVVVTDRENPRDGKFIEQIGTYDPSKPWTDAKIDDMRLAHWVSNGALVSPTLDRVLRARKVAAAAVAK
ncbi:MAG: 30S ribosomal protein S16 [Sandaracinaceae bacterium]|nr:30S ribosomal protein S16 [Sandaracinaceae bacterium]